MDRSHCPIGALREQEQKIAALGLRIALDDLRLRWSWEGQLRCEEKKSIADKALAAWNEHIQYCPTCRDARSGLEAVNLQTGLVPPPALLLVDDNPALLELLVGMLRQKYTIVAALSNGAAVLERAADLNPDLIILDISLGDMSGFEVARRLKKAGCPAKVIFLTLHEDMDFAGAAFGLGASGYVFKSRLCTDLENAIDTVLSGGHFSSIS
jgi:CheY-like chemotaxis protein